jgi:hypothetical protein
MPKVHLRCHQPSYGQQVQLGQEVSTAAATAQQIIVLGVLTVLCPVLVSPSREAYRRAVVILVLVIALVFVTRVPMAFPQLPEIPELPPLPPIF